MELSLLKAYFSTATAGPKGGTTLCCLNVTPWRECFTAGMYGLGDFASPARQPAFPPASPGSGSAQVAASPPLQSSVDAVREELAALEQDVEAALAEPGLDAQRVLGLLRTTRARIGALRIGDDDDGVMATLL